MAQPYVEITPGSGKKIETEEYVDGANTIERQGVAINNLAEALRDLLRAIGNPPGKDSLGRQQIFLNGGQLGVLGSVTAVAAVTAVAYAGQPGPPAGSFLSGTQLQACSGSRWSDIRARIS
jgi:hypothetical protein